MIKGNGAVSKTLNRYGYCWGNPVGLVDNDGKFPLKYILPPILPVPMLPLYEYMKNIATQTEEGTETEEGTAYVYYIDDFEREAKWQIQQLENQGLNVTSYDLSEADSMEEYDDEKQRGQYFMDLWENMDDSEQIDYVYIFCHGSERMLLFEEGSYYNGLTIDGKNSKNEEVAGELNELDKKNINNLYIQACNTGLVAVYEVGEINVAKILSTKIADDGITYAWDGSVSFGPSAIKQGINNFFGVEYDLEARTSRKQSHYKDVIHRINEDYGTSYSLTPKGQVKYKGGEYVECD